MVSDQHRKAFDVKQNHEESWMKLKGVVAVGLGIIGGETGIIVSVKKDSDLIRKKIPPAVDGVPVVIKQAGEISAL